jgi:hypothetical protein
VKTKTHLIDLTAIPVEVQAIEQSSQSIFDSAYNFELINIRLNGMTFLFDTHHERTIYQAPAWLAYLSKTQNGEPIVAALKEGPKTIGYFTGLVVKKSGVRILGSPFPGWSTDYMGLTLSPLADRRRAFQALIDFAFRQLGCLHLEGMDRQMTEADLCGLGLQYRLYHSFEIDLTRNEDELFANMKSACRRCIRKANKEGVFIEEAHDLKFADDYYAQLRDVFRKRRLVPTYGIERVRQLIRSFHPTGHLLLLRALDRRGQCIATGIFPHLNGVMHFWGGASWRHSQSLRPNEALQWQAMKIAKRMGIRIYDMGGGGEYKRKYGGKEIAVPWFWKSKFRSISFMRNMAQYSHRVRQHFLGQFNHFLARDLKDA